MTYSSFHNHFKIESESTPTLDVHQQELFPNNSHLNFLPFDLLGVKLIGPLTAEKETNLVDSTWIWVFGGYLCPLYPASPSPQEVAALPQHSPPLFRPSSLTTLNPPNPEASSGPWHFSTRPERRS